MFYREHDHSRLSSARDADPSKLNLMKIIIKSRDPLEQIVRERKDIKAEIQPRETICFIHGIYGIIFFFEIYMSYQYK